MSHHKSTKPIDRLVRSAFHAKDYEDVAALPVGDNEPERIAQKWTAGMAQHFRQRFAQQLQELRQQAGLSLHGLADRAGVNHSQLVRLESAERSCTLETAVKIAAALGVSLGLLTDGARAV
jgi:ribosome-binding protein aMBF1 (putative translation factor)